MLKVMKSKDDKKWVEVLNFNPLLIGYSFVKACCCRVDFEKSGKTVSFHKDKNRTDVYKDGKRINTFVYPKNMEEMKILDKWI